MSRSGTLLLFLALGALVLLSSAVPIWWDQIFPTAPPPSRQSRDSYKAACRIINPDPYAHIGSVPYPAAPFCPY